MIINKSELLNSVISIDEELQREGKEDTNHCSESYIDIQDAVEADMLNPKDYKSDADYENALEAEDETFADGEDRLDFVPRDTVLCSALMDFYAPDGNVKDFEKVAKKNIIGFHSQMLTNENEGFWFVVGSNMMDALVPYNKQKTFMKSVNPKLNSDETKIMNRVLNKATDDLQAKNNNNHKDYSLSVKSLKSARQKLQL